MLYDPKWEKPKRKQRSRFSRWWWPVTVDEVFAKIEAVGAEDICAVAREIMRPEFLNLAMIGPFQEKTKFEKLLEEFE